MSTELLGLRTVIYPAPNLEAAKSYWAKFLGQDPYFDQPFYVGFDVAGYELGLLPDADPNDGAVTYWGVDNVAQALTDAVNLGASIHSPATEVGDSIVTGSARLADGTVLGFIYNPHFKLG